MKTAKTFLVYSFLACRTSWRAMARGPLSLFLGCAFLLGGAGSVQAQQASRCAPQLERADSLYQRRAFSAAAQQARQCLQQSRLPVREQRTAFRLFALAQLRQGNQETARQAVSGLLRAVPGYEPDPVQDPPSYVTLVTDEQQRLRAAGRLPEAPPPPRPPWYERRSTWLVVGGGLIATGLIAIFSGG